MSFRDLTSTDHKILTILQANAREKVSNIARKIRMSRNAVVQRLHRLEKSGVISGYTIRLGEPSKLRNSVQAYLLIYLTGPICERVLPSIARIPEIKISQSISGDIDMICYAEGETLADLNRVRDELERIRGVTKVVTAPILAHRFDRR
jgi:Lrp/AsnC family transcriptional regulator, leucine-responsive regulatory protein